MVIDIIAYTEEQFARLTVDELTEVRSAQTKKNKLQEKLSDDIRALEGRFAKQGLFLSSVLETERVRLTEAYEEEVAAIRESLLFYLRYASNPLAQPGTTAPYALDYSLSDIERYTAVRNYYMTTYTDAEERFEAFKQDEVAPQYLTEYYATLYDFLLGKIEK